MKKTLSRLALALSLLVLTAGVAFGGKIVQMAISNGGALDHIVSVVDIDVSADGSTATVEIRDTDANPAGTSTVTVDIASRCITSHTGTTTQDYTGWKVKSIWEYGSAQEAGALRHH